MYDENGKIRNVVTVKKNNIASRNAAMILPVRFLKSGLFPNDDWMLCLSIFSQDPRLVRPDSY